MHVEAIELETTQGPRSRWDALADRALAGERLAPDEALAVFSTPHSASGEPPSGAR